MKTMKNFRFGLILGAKQATMVTLFIGVLALLLDDRYICFLSYVPDVMYVVVPVVVAGLAVAATFLFAFFLVMTLCGTVRLIDDDGTDISQPGWFRGGYVCGMLCGIVAAAVTTCGLAGVHCTALITTNFVSFELDILTALLHVALTIDLVDQIVNLRDSLRSSSEKAPD